MFSSSPRHRSFPLTFLALISCGWGATVAVTAERGRQPVGPRDSRVSRGALPAPHPLPAVAVPVTDITPTPAPGRLLLWLESDAEQTGVEPGGTVKWSLRGEVQGDNAGLALFSVDLRQSESNPVLFDLPTGDAAPSGMKSLDRPYGFSNPGPTPDRSGYGGTPLDLLGHADLRQIGGALNVFGVPGPCFGAQASACAGQQTQVEEKLAHVRGGTLLATGSFVVPAAPGSYDFFLADARAQVLAGIRASSGAGGIADVPVSLEKAALRIAVGTVGFVGSRAFSLPAADVVSTPGSGRPVRPRPGSVINHSHVLFRWPAVPGAGAYTLEVVLDNGAPDPFVAGVPMTHFVAGGEPRHEVTSGLTFGRSYAWRAVPAPGSVVLPAPVHRFRIAPFPSFVRFGVPSQGPDYIGMRADRPEPGPIQPGITLFNIGRRSTTAFRGAFAMAVDQDGNPVYFTHITEPDRNVATIGLVEVRDETGRLLMVRGRTTREGDTGRAVFDQTLDGRVAWTNPPVSLDGAWDYDVHHDADIMPDGDVLLLNQDDRFLPEDSEDLSVRRRGDRLVVLDRNTLEEKWTWTTFDHWSIEAGEQDPSRSWTHVNTVNYNRALNSVFISSKHFSRVSRIDFATGDIVFNMGKFWPTDAPDFGDGFHYHQHDPEPQPNGNILIYDNGNERRPFPFSRAVEVAFDDPEDPSTATVVWSYEPVGPFGNPVYTPAVGDADRLANGNTLVVAGFTGSMFEATPDGATTWTMQVGSFNSGHLLVYRAQRLDSLFKDTPGDWDGDSDVDLEDLGRLMAGRTGPKPAPLPFPAYISDFDGDSDLDHRDAAALVRWMTGPLE